MSLGESIEGPTGSGSEGITIWYRVDSEESPLEKLKNFSGLDASDLREAVKNKSKLTDPARTLMLVVAGSGGREIDLDDMYDLLDDGGFFNFAKLINDYGINEDSPILVRLPFKGLTEKQLLALVPPPITHLPAEKAENLTYSPWGCTPHSVQKWDDFIQNANGMAVDNTTPQFNKPIFMDYKASEEEVIRNVLQINVLDVLSKTIGEQQPSKEGFYRSSEIALDPIKGNPDFVLLSGGNILLKGQTNKFLLPIEVKTRWILPDDNIVEILDAGQPPVCLSNSITQIFGYMAHNRRRYGVLSTYDKTWFLRRPENDTGALFISDAVKYGDTSPTLLRSFAYIMFLARQGCDCPFPPPSPPQTLGDINNSSGKHDEDEEPTYQPPNVFSSGCENGGQDSGRGDAGKGDNSNTRKRNRHHSGGKREAPGNKRLNTELRLEKFDWDSFEVSNLLGGGRCGKVFEGTLRGERVAIKLTDLWQEPELHEEMLNEARVYVELRKLQGHGIPRLKGLGYTAGGLFAMMTEFGGSPIKVENLNDAQREMIVEVLAGMHGEGFIHGDIRWQNILVDYLHDGPRITFIDFGFTRKCFSHEESEIEMAALGDLIGVHSIKKPPIHNLGG